MKHRLLDGCLNPFKHHLWRLPDIPKEQQPISYSGHSRRALVVFPLFQATSGDDASLEHHLVRSACWARRSWIIFSDAVDVDVQFGFYVGDTVFDRVVPILEANGIDIDADVFIMHEAPFEGEPCTHLGKKMSVFSDFQFAEYEWVLQMDCDMFLASANGDRFNFFGDYLFNRPQHGIGAVKAHFVPTHYAPFQNIGDYHWHLKLLDTDSQEEKVKEWLHRASRLVSEEVLSGFEDRFKFIIECHGGIYAFPARQMWDTGQDKLEWIARAGKALQDDEAVFSLWAMRGDPLFCISAETEVPFCTEIGLIDQVRLSGVYYSHIANLVNEWHWRQDIDAL